MLLVRTYTILHNIFVLFFSHNNAFTIIFFMQLDAHSSKLKASRFQIKAHCSFNTH